MCLKYFLKETMIKKQTIKHTLLYKYLRGMFSMYKHLV